MKDRQSKFANHKSWQTLFVGTKCWLWPFASPIPIKKIHALFWTGWVSCWTSTITCWKGKGASSCCCCCLNGVGWYLLLVTWINLLLQPLLLLPYKLLLSYISLLHRTISQVRMISSTNIILIRIRIIFLLLLWRSILLANQDSSNICN